MRLFLALLLILPLRAEPTITLVPLDDRPCNLLFVRQIARIAGAETTVPPRSLLGAWLRPGDPERVADWLRTHPAPYTLVSADMLCYGGLVGARQAQTSLATARERLRVLRELRGGRLEVLAVLPRLSLRTSDRQAPYEGQLARWAHRPRGTPAPAGVPPEIVQEYLEVRQRNLQVLGTLLEYVQDGTLARLVVGQDDSAATGLHRAEADWLLDQARQRELGDRFVFLSGADELSMDLVSGYLADYHDVHPTVEVVYSDPAARDRIPPLETYPLGEMVEAHLALSGARPGSPAEVALFVRVPEDQSPLEPFLEELVARLGRQKVALADLGRVNRMDPALAEALIAQVPLTRLEALAGWNTAANGLGTATAQLVCHRIAARQGGWTLSEALESEKTQQAFLFARLVDDYGYQAVVRPERDGLPLDPDPLLNLYGPIGLEIRQALRLWALGLFQDRFRGQVVALESIGRRARIDRLQLEIVLPWQRVFEIEARADLTLTGLPATRH